MGIGLFLILIFQVSAQVHPAYLPDKMGVWQPFRMSCSGSGQGITAEQNRVYSSKLQKLSEAIHHAQVFNPPMGIEARPTGCVNATIEFLDDYPGNRTGPIPGYVMIGTFSYADYAGTTRVVVADEGPHFFVDVNSLVQLYHGSAVIAKDERGEMFLEPGVARTVTGLPLYENGCIVITRNPQPIFQAVTVERFLRARIRETQAELADFQRRHQDLVGESRQKSDQQSYQRLMARNPADAEKFRQSTQQARQRDDQLFTKLEQSKQTEIAGYQSQLASLSSEQRGSQAYASLNYYANGKHLLVNTNQPGAKPLVGFNPDFYDRSRPRTDVQSIAVCRLYEKELRKKSYDPQYERLIEFRNSFDFQTLTPMLDR